MCGIIGVFNTKNNEKIVKEGLKIIKYRGRDGKKVINEENYTIGHLLHSIISHVKQPLKEDNTILAANCEIYNYKKLKKKYDIIAENDAELLLKLINKIGLSEALEKIDGVYAFIYIKKNKVYLVRDIIGVKPLWYSKEPFCFASERKALKKIEHIRELNPRRILVYDIKKKRISYEQRKFFSIGKEYEKKEEEMIEKTKDLLIKSVKKRIPENTRIGLLFSGGVDSTTIAIILKNMGVDFTCYASGVEDSKDLKWAEKAAEKHGLKLEKRIFTKEEVREKLPEICRLIESNNIVKTGVAIPFYFAAGRAKKDGVKVIFSGLGSEEIFAGYNRHKKSTRLNKECYYGLLRMYYRDLYRDDIITMRHNIELRLPFLDHKLIRHALRIPAEQKINSDYKKIILRKVSKKIGVSKSVVWRKKKAAQYGSKSDKILEKLSPGYKSEYLKKVYPQNNTLLGILYSSGKDSNLAINIMKRRNYEIACLITMLTERDDSYMFHQTQKKIVEAQSESLSIPVIFGKTKGEKEKELKDLKNTIKKAVEKHHIDGVVSGALFSNYQRDRIINICEELGLKTYSPLWHKEQEEEIKELLRKDFKFIMTSVAALGLNKTWLNKVITSKEVKELKKLEEKYGLNMTGEGGEYESLVLNSPDFKKEIRITDYEIIDENKNTAHMKIKKLTL